jgi:hypothetical protein
VKITKRAVVKKRKAVKAESRIEERRKVKNKEE